MAENSKISWTTHTFNPWMGCVKVSPGCANCYAETLMDSRYGKVKWGANGTRVMTSPANWRKPLKWNRDAEDSGVRARVFCASLADVFESWKGPVTHHQGGVLYRTTGGMSVGLFKEEDREKMVTLDDLRRELFHLIDATPWLDWLLLTKRPENIIRFWPRTIDASGPNGELEIILEPRDNVWIGTSIENQDEIDRWVNVADCRDLSPVLWVSAEPLLGPLDVMSLDHRGIFPDWIVFGGESDQGQKARPCNLEWLRSGVMQCRELGIVPFVKQVGSNAYDPVPSTMPWHRREKAGANPDEWPADIRVREFPNPVSSAG